MKSHRTNVLIMVGVLLLFPLVNSYAQHYGNKFIIAPNNYANDFSADRIAQQVYFDYYGGWSLKLDLKTADVESTRFIGPVTFGNKQHLAFNRDTLYDLDKGSYHAVIPRDTISNLGWSFKPFFSPNDSNLMLSIGYPEPYPISFINNNFIFSLKDSSLIPIDTNVRTGYSLDTPQWSSDTSFVFAASDSSIAEYFIHSRRIDTLVSLHSIPYNKIVSFAYNTRRNILAYSTSVGSTVPDASPLIYFHHKDSTLDFLTFSPFRDDSMCWHTPLAAALTSLCWSPNNDKLGFIGYGPTNDISEIYSYSLDSNRTYKVTQCNDPDDKYDLTWANEDTLVYVDNANFHIYGVDISTIDAIKRKKDEPIPIGFDITSYPNPFNPTTTIEATLPWHTNGVLSIHDAQGRLIREYEIKNDGSANYKITWNAVNSHSVGIASGFYMAVLRIDNPQSQNRRVTKLIYLK